MTFKPELRTLPPSQLKLWPELSATPTTFTLYSGTALALRLGHRTSINFDFFSNEPFDPDALSAALPYLDDAERIQVDANTLPCRVERGGPVLISFFGGLGLGQAAAHDVAEDTGLRVAPLLDIAATKAAVVQKRAEVKDYLDMGALLAIGVALPMMLAAAAVVYGPKFNPLITLKALTYFDDLPNLPEAVRARLLKAVLGVDVTRIPVLTPYAERPTRGLTP